MAFYRPKENEMKSKTQTPVALILAAGLLVGFSPLVQTVEATPITLDDVNAARIQDGDEDGNGDSVQQHQMWSGNIAADDWGVVFTFQMTGLSDGSLIDDANFSVTQDSAAGSPTLLADVFTRASTAINASDYELAATTLMSGFGGANALQELDVGGQGALTTYLQSNWVENDHVFIRLKSATFPVPAGQAYRFGTTQGGYSGSSVDAQLNLSVVPEPSVLGLLVLGGLLLGRRRRILKP